MSSLTSLLDEKASKLAEQVSDFGRDAADVIDHARTQTAGGLQAAASSIRRNVREGSRVVVNLADSAATRLDEAGSYVKKHDLRRTLGESRHIIRRYPGGSLALAAGVGFLTALAIRRLTHTCAKSHLRPAA
jgi:hypothetical protein